ncbi:MAG: cytochrome c [Vicinamibacterales bacterium]
MTRRFARQATGLLGAGAILLWAVGGAAGAAQPARSVNDGVYTTAQAERGAKIFDKTCTACHDTARFTGAEFTSAWTGLPLKGLFDAVQTMPEDNPGSLPPQEYADIIAFFLQLNQYKPGESELMGNAEAMGAVAMEARKP